MARPKDKLAASDGIRCAARWPTSRFKQRRMHVELAETSAELFQMHLKDCLPGSERDHARRADEKITLAIVRMHSKHPDVEAGRRKPSEIWLEYLAARSRERKDSQQVDENRSD